MAVINGPYAQHFWFGEIFLGLVAPLIIILAVRARHIGAMAFGSLLSIIGIFIMRYDLLLVGQIIPGFHSMNLEGVPSILPYSASLHEWMITFAGFTFCAVLFMLGERFFRGHLSEDH